MNQGKLVFLVFIAMLAFAANSLFARLALAETDIDAATFTAIRIVSGALALALLVFFQQKANPQQISHKVKSALSWPSTFALFIYAAGFSYAYVALSTGTGAVLLFGAVQITMMAFALYKGERFTLLQTLGFAVAVLGVLVLLLPGATAPALIPAAIMLAAGVAWGVYSIRGAQGHSPLHATTANFIAASPLALVLLAFTGFSLNVSVEGIVYALLSGAIASGLGYALWYAVLTHLKASTAATAQLSVPIIAAIAGILVLSEDISLRLLLSGAAVLGGIWLVISRR